MSEDYTSSFGIYAIENALTGCLYVGGTTKTFAERWKAHRNLLNKGAHYTTLLQEAWERDSADAFGFRVLEVVEDRTQVAARERYWMEELQPAYNSSYIAVGYGSAQPQYIPGGTVKLSLSKELSEQLDRTRGLRTRQDFIIDAIINAIEGSPTERMLRAEIAKLHQTVRSFAGVMAHRAAPVDDQLSFD